ACVACAPAIVPPVARTFIFGKAQAVESNASSAINMRAANRVLYDGIFMVSIRGLTSQTGMRHVLRLQQFIELLLRQPALGDDKVINAAASLECFLGDRGGLFVAEDGVKGRHEADGVLHVFTATLAVRFDAGDATRSQNDGGVAEQGQAEEKIKRDDRLGHVQL